MKSTGAQHISVTLPCDDAWLGFAQQFIRHYGRQVGFSEKLETMVTLSVMEALENLFQRAAGTGVSQPVSLEMDHKGLAVVIDIGYESAIPLHPHETGDWEVPDDLDDLDEQDMDTLWLHLIKKRMDRVCFMIQGNRRILRMAKYNRDEGREKQAWIMGVTPRLKPDLIVHVDDPEKKFPSAILQAPGKGVLRLGPSETFLVGLMDGQTPFHDLYMAHVDALGLIAPTAMALLYEQLEKMEMLVPEGILQDRNRFYQAFKRWLNPDWVIPRADETVTWVYKRCHPLFSHAGAGLLIAVGISGLVPLLIWYQDFSSQVAGLEQAFAAHPILFVCLYTLMLFDAACHELGHGTVCKHFGGKVPRIGIMFYLASFMFYCDTTASLNFKRKRDRLLVSLAGPLVSFAILGVGLWAGGLSFGTGLAPVMTAFCLISCFGLVMSFNPFIKMDAYYMLSDITGIANLRKKSFDFLKFKLRKGLGKKEVRETQDKKEKREMIFWVYGIGGVMITGFFLIFPLVRLFHFLKNESASGGILALISLLIFMICFRLSHLAIERISGLRNQVIRIQ